MHFFVSWIFIVFCWGGLGFIIWALISLKKQQNKVTVDLKKIQSSFKILLVFVILATIGFGDYFILSIGSIKLQFLNNLLTGLVFILFVYKLRKAIDQKTDNQSLNIDSGNSPAAG